MQQKEQRIPIDIAQKIKTGPHNTRTSQKKFITIRNILADPVKISLFKEVCACSRGGSSLPIVFPETLFSGMATQLMVSSGVSLSREGLIYIKRTIEQARPIYPDEKMDLTCSLIELRISVRGTEADCFFEALIDGISVWSGIGTFLSRDTAYTGMKKKKTPESIFPVKTCFEVPADTGLKYAAASGDYNAHHLKGFPSGLTGFNRSIAHGMWSIARCMAEMEKSLSIEYPVKMQASLKLPVYLPASLSLGYTRDQDSMGLDCIRFELRDKKSRLPHLIGKVICK